MVGLSDIPCVGIAVQRISEATVNTGFRILRYWLCYKTFVNQLNSEIEKVKVEEILLSRKVDAAKNNGKTIEKHVVEWQEKVEKAKTLADELSKQRTSCTCFKVLPFPNMISHFRVGKKAAQQSKYLADLIVSAAKLVANEVGYLPPVENLPTTNTTYHSFASRQEAYGKLWDALGDKNGDPIIGIYGMPGVGKTRMMEQAWKDAKDKNIFDKVARVNVSGEKFHVINLQEKLSASLGCHLESKDNENQRASQLKNSLMNGGKTLVILDDVWDVIPLYSIGIPFGDGSYHGCKILLTSRKQDVCFRNKCKDPIEIKILTDDEAWEMFRNAVGSTKLETLKDASLAEKVCKKCAALPLLIDAVGNALKFVTENLWRDALYQLENHKFEEIEGIEPEVYGCLQLSFEKLNVEARACLFLCSLFPEDDDIEIKALFDFATGSQLLDRERNIYAVIDILKSCSLLLEGKNEQTIKLHDIIRDAARSIAARDAKYTFLSVRCSSRLPDNIDYHTPRLLQLDLKENNVRVPDDLVFPDLHTLWLQGINKRKQLSGGFFERFSNLKFLVLQGMSFPDQQQISIHRLEKLRKVIFHNCDIHETFVSSMSENLETLCIWECDLPSTLELPDLKHLRKLELFNNSEINMDGEAISGLSSLEELKIIGAFTIRGNAGYEATSIFGHLSQLTRFKTLVLNLDPSYPYYPDKDLVNKLVEFNINVDYGHDFRSLKVLSNNLIKLSWVDIENGWMALVERAEKVEIGAVKGLANGFGNSDMREAFANLRELYIYLVDDMNHVASWDGRNQQLGSSFSNLTSVRIHECGRLKYLFSPTVVKCLHQMQQLEVQSCYQIQEIIWTEEGRTDQGEIICFPKLKELNLHFLESLRSFYKYTVTFPNLEKMSMWDLNTCFSTQKIELARDDSSPKLNTLWLVFEDQEVELPSQWLLQLKNIEILKLCNCRWTGDSVFNGTPTFGRLRVLEISHCGDTSLFRCSSLTFLQQLETLEVSDCPLLENILWGAEPHADSNEVTTILLPQLKSLSLIRLLKLRNCGIFACNMPALEQVNVYECGVSTLFTSSAFTSIQQLYSLKVGCCPLLESIVEDEMLDETPKDTISLLRLKHIVLHELPGLKSPRIFAYNLPALEDLRIVNCGFSSLFTSSAFTSLHKLSSLQVKDCPLLESIVEDELHDETPKTTVSLSCLKDIHLSSLGRFKSFSSSPINGLNMPALADVKVYDCPLMHTFSLSDVMVLGVNFETLHRSYTNVSDLNRSVRVLYGIEKESNASDEESSADGEELVTKPEEEEDQSVANLVEFLRELGNS